MRNTALHFPELGKVEFVDDGAPRELNPAEVLIETRYSGITNGTERHAMMAEHFWGVFPSQHGYQQVGTVVAVGSDVTDYQVGDWTFNGNYVGHHGWNIVDTARENLVVKLPQSTDYSRYALLGVAGVAMKGVRRFGIRPADKVLVTGVGPIGFFSAMAARAHGAEVTATDPNAQRLAIARQQGCDHVVDVKDPDYWGKLRALGKFNYVIDASGYESLFYDIFQNELLAHGGAICPMAVRLEARFPWSMLHQTDGRIEVSCHFDREDLEVLLSCIGRGVIKSESIITHSVSIDDAPEVYTTLRDRPSELFGVVFDWS